MFMKLRKKLSKSRKGFTLVELIIVMAILGILASIAIPTFAGVREKAIVKADIASATSIIHELRQNFTESGTASSDLLTEQNAKRDNDFTAGGTGATKFTVTWTAANAGAGDTVAAIEDDNVERGASTGILVLTEQ